MVKVRILRSSPSYPGTSWWAHYEVPYFSHMDIIDVLVYIQTNIDDSLAFQYSCKEGKCGLCGIRVNGEPVLACRRIVKPGEELNIEPLRVGPVLQDLLIDWNFIDHYRCAIAQSLESSGRLKTVSSRYDIFLALSQCARCGVCFEVCPLFQSETALGPHAVHEACYSALCDEVCLTQREALFSCFICGACASICPQGVKMPELVIEARALVSQRHLQPVGITQIVKRVKDRGTLFSRPSVQGTAGWLDGAETWIKDRAKVCGTSVGLFIGCQYGLRPYLQQIPQKLCHLLQCAGIDFTFLGTDEICCGHPAYLAGARDVFAWCADKLVNEFAKLKVKTVVTLCPGCYRAWAVEYPKTLPHDFTVLPISAFLLQLYENGRFPPTRYFNSSWVYHDPCELGRLSRFYEEARKLLATFTKTTGAVLERQMDKSLCCGGGGLVPFSLFGLAKRVAGLRLKELIDTTAAVIVTSCPTCKFMLTTAFETNKDVFEEKRVLDLIELIYESVEAS
ncbi:MAG: heterodisulfide reductase-related iron-sulfur binding cluster [Candidatus Methanomethyliaceae archaeon]